MKEMIIETLHGRFCDMEIKELAEVDSAAIAAVAERFGADAKGEIFVEKILMDTICNHENVAFREGFNACVELFKTLLGR